MVFAVLEPCTLNERAQCPIVPLLPLPASVGLNTTDTYQLIIRLSWCEVSNDVNSFLLYGQAARSAEVEMVASSIVAVVWQARPSQYAPGGVVGKGRSSGDSDLFTPFSYQCHTSNYHFVWANGSVYCTQPCMRVVHRI